MRDEDKKRIEDMRSIGMSYAKIGDVLGLSINTIKSHCRRHDIYKVLCRNCGKQLEIVPKQKARIFCSDWCRRTWWKTNRDRMRRKAVYHLHCETCGRHFESYGNSKRKYCSHTCYIADRFGEDAL